MHRPHQRAADEPLRRQTWRILGCALFSLLAPLTDAPLPADDDAPPTRIVWHTGRSLTQELARPVNIVLQRTTPRRVVLRLRELHQIALLLDRRIDPDRPIDVQFTQVSLQEALQAFAVQLEADCVQVGGTLLIGPKASTDRIRTLIELRTRELRQSEGQDAIGRQFTLLRGTTLRWNDLAEPASLVDEVCAAFVIERTDEVRVPHDLWAAGVMADVNAIEALMLLLGQFDLTFAWEQQSAAIRLHPMPPSATVLREHLPPQQELAAAVALIREQFPHLKPQISGRSILLEATVGEHEAVVALLDPPPQRPREASLGPLSRRRFTLKAPRAEAIAVLRTLQTQDVVIEYDPAALQSAGIDLQQAVTLELDKATAEELFRQLCEPLGLSFEIEDSTVRLFPASPPPGRDTGEQQGDDE
jgi:hypothetical protein